MSPGSPADPPGLAGLAPLVAAGRAHVTRRAAEDWVSVECLHAAFLARALAARRG